MRYTQLDRRRYVESLIDEAIGELDSLIDSDDGSFVIDKLAEVREHLYDAEDVLYTTL